MGSFSIWHWLIVLAVAVVLFGGGGKLSRLMGDFGRGLREFKSSLEGEPQKRGSSKGIGKGKDKNKDTDTDADEDEDSTAGSSASTKKGKKKS